MRLRLLMKLAVMMAKRPGNFRIGHGLIPRASNNYNLSDHEIAKSTISSVIKQKMILSNRQACLRRTDITVSVRHAYRPGRCRLSLEAAAGNHSSTNRPLGILSGAETVNLFQHANRHEVRPSPRNCPIFIALSFLAP